MEMSVDGRDGGKERKRQRNREEGTAVMRKKGVGGGLEAGWTVGCRTIGHPDSFCGWTTETWTLTRLKLRPVLSCRAQVRLWVWGARG